MTILSVCQEAAKVIAIAVPSVVTSSTRREHVELLAVANEMADRIAKGHDWQALAKVATITGTGAAAAFDLPTDYDRMLVKSQLWSTMLQTPFSHITDLDKWLQLDTQAFDFVVNAWTIYGGQIHVKPTMPTTTTARYFYISNEVVKASNGSTKTDFTSDDDTFRLNEQLLKLGIIWQWRANKGLPYAEDMANYEQLLERLVLRDRGSSMLRIGRVRMPSDVQVAYPQAIQP